jgi:hypothetical protein
MTFVCIKAGADECRYVWCSRYVWYSGSGGHFYARLADHQRFAIAKIWQWWYAGQRRGPNRTGGL